jgi:hypothetical protein
MKTKSLLILFFAIAAAVAPGCHISPTSKAENGLEGDMVSYPLTVGIVKAQMAYTAEKIFGKRPFFKEAQEARAISGQQALELLNTAGYTTQQPSHSLLPSIRRVLGAQGAIAIFLPSWAPGKESGTSSSILYVPYPKESNFTTGLPSTCDGFYFNLTKNPYNSSDETCQRCEGGVGENPHTEVKACSCAQYSGCFPCDSCGTCYFAKPLPERMSDMCSAVSGCQSSVFFDTRPLSEVPIGSWL